MNHDNVSDTYFLEQSPEFRALTSAKGKLAQVCERLSDLRHEEEQIADHLRTIANADPHNVAELANAFLDGNTEVDDRETLAQQLEQIRGQIGIVEKAVEIQQGTVDRTHGDYSALVCRELFRPKYAEAAKRVVAAIEELAAAFQSEDQCCDKMRVMGIERSNMPTIRGPIVNQFLDREWVRRFITEVQKYYPEIDD